MRFSDKGPLIVALLWTIGTQAVGQTEGPIVASIERFAEECREAMSAPSAYFEEARSQGQDSPVAVARVEEEDLYWVLDMTPPGEIYVHIGEIGGQTRVYCHLGVFNIPEVRDASATNEAFLDWFDAQDGLERTGGAVDLKALMAGDAGVTGEQVEMTAQVFQHLLKGWSAVDAVADVAVQTGMLEISSEIMLPMPLTISD